MSKKPKVHEASLLRGASAPAPPAVPEEPNDAPVEDDAQPITLSEFRAAPVAVSEPTVETHVEVENIPTRSSLRAASAHAGKATYRVWPYGSLQRNGALHEAGTTLELTESQAAEIGGCVTRVEDEIAVTTYAKD
jgi:hypothetical protein